jgi:hypothetical protein
MQGQPNAASPQRGSLELANVTMDSSSRIGTRGCSA